MGLICTLAEKYNLTQKKKNLKEGTIDTYGTNY